jgi:starch synthase (maltosyl-transferring)
LIAFSKSAPGTDEAVLCVVNLDPHNAQSGSLDLDLEALKLDADRPFQAHDQ